MSKTWLDVSETWLEEPPTAECSTCHRQTWDADSIGVSCGMPQPDGSICGGVFTNEARVRRYGRTIWETSRADESTISATGANIVARAVIAVADEEQAALRAEVERLTRECLDREATETDARERLRQAEATLAAVEALHVPNADGSACQFDGFCWPCETATVVSGD